MKGKILAVLLTGFLLTSSVRAQAEEIELPTPGILPDQPILYFLENLKEEIETFLATDPVKKAEKYLLRASERVAEVQAMIQRGKPELAEKVLIRYDAQLQKGLEKVEVLSSQGVNTDELAQKVAATTLKHQEVLMDVYEKVPAQAKDAIQKALEKSSNGHKQAIKAVSDTKRGEAEEKVRAKKEQLEERRGRLNLPTPPR